MSLALSPEKPPQSPHYLYVACYDGSTLDIIDLNSPTFSSVSKQLDAKPQGVAVRAMSTHQVTQMRLMAALNHPNASATTVEGLV